MGFNLTHALGLYADTLKLRAERTKVLASNLANVNTPGYQAVDLDVKRALAQPDAFDAGLLGASPGSGLTLGYRVPNLASADGNTVELGVEQAAFAQNATEFQMSLTFLNMKLHELKSAITGNV